MLSFVHISETPVRLFKHQVQKEAENAPNKKASKPASAHVSRLIVSLVSQCKHRGGISMADLKNTLATEGYNVTKNNKQVNVVTNRLINNESLVRTTRNTSFRLPNKVKDYLLLKFVNIFQCKVWPSGWDALFCMN